ncbi:MAG: hypothetical protein RID81_07150 [Sandaracinaceae bacterium]
MNVEDVLTHEQLANALLGSERLENLLPAAWDGDSSTLRRAALDDVLEHLANRTPPIRETALPYPEDLRTATRYVAIERLYREAMTDERDTFAVNRRIYEKKANTALASLSPRVGAGLRGPGLSLQLERR